MKYDMKIFICFSCAITSTPTNTKPTLSGWAQGEDIIKKKITQYLLSSQSYVLFSKSAMTFDLKNPRWPPSVAILDFENCTYLMNLHDVAKLARFVRTICLTLKEWVKKPSLKYLLCTYCYLCFILVLLLFVWCPAIFLILDNKIELNWIELNWIAMEVDIGMVFF